MKSVLLDITGMTCDHCARSAEAALNALPGVQATVSYAEGLARVQTAAPVASLIDAVRSRGYGATARASDESPSGPTHVAIIGTGSGGFAAAIKAAAGGARVTMIEAGEVIGGTCVNVGCVPSKIMIRGARLAHQQAHPPFDGLAPHVPLIDRAALVRQQQGRVEELRQAKYIDVLRANPAVSLVRGRAVFEDEGTLRVTAADGTITSISADRVLVATGARPLVPDISGLSDTPFWTSTEALVAPALPEHLVVLGAGVVALELAQAFLRLGSRVTILARSTLLSKLDPQLGEGLRAALEAEGATVRTHTRVEHVEHDAGTFTLHTDAGPIQADRLLVAAGRRPNTDALGLERVGVHTDETGAIIVDDHLQTSNPRVFAVGDCTRLPRYVYVAAAAGTRAGANMTGGDDVLDLSVLPEVVFSDPAVATVGLTESLARARGIAVESRTLELEHVPRALANFDTRGFIKLVADADTGRLLGAQVLAPEAGELIQTAALALRAGMTTATLAGQLFPYLTMVEGLKLCAQTFTMDVSQLSCCAG